MKSFKSLSALVAAKHSKLRLATAAFTVLSAALTVPASAQFHVQQPQMPAPVAPAAPIAPAETHGWPFMSPDLVALRSSSSPAEKKLTFNLFLITRHDRNALIAPFTSLMDTHSVNADGTVNVEISAYLSPSLMANPVMERVVMVNGGEIPEHAYETDLFQARVTPRQLLDLAANPNVVTIRDINSAPVNASVTPGGPLLSHRSSN
jgi:hypothetical protein